MSEKFFEKIERLIYRFIIFDELYYLYSYVCLLLIICVRNFFWILICVFIEFINRLVEIRVIFFVV